MVTFKALLLELLILANYYWYKTQSEEIIFRIGALLSNDDTLEEFERLVQSEENEFNISGTNIRFEPLSELMKRNALQTTDQVCNFIKQSDGRLLALIVSHPPNSPQQPPLSASFTAAFFELPTIGISARQSAFSDKTSHNFFLRTITPYSQEATAFVSLIRKFGWKFINVIYSDDHEGKTLLSKVEKLSDNLFHIRSRVALKDEEANYTELLRDMSQEQTRVVLLYCGQEYVEGVYLAAKELGMLERDWAWLVTEPALEGKFVPDGILGVRLSESKEQEHMKDAIRVVIEGLAAAFKENPRRFKRKLLSSTCDDKLRYPYRSSRISSMNLLHKAMRDVRLVDGKTGPVSFDQAGDREQASYHIVNTQNNGKPVKVGTFETSSPIFLPFSEPGNSILVVNMEKVKWPPGNYQITVKEDQCQLVNEHMLCLRKITRTKLVAPKSFKKKTHLKVVTIKSIPFVYTRPIKDGQMCKTSKNPLEPKAEVECTHTDPITKVKTRYCCFGYCIDLLRRLADRTSSEDSDSTDMEKSFTYDLHLVGDNQIGELITDDNGQQRWTGIVEELSQGMADLGISPMTITPERATRIDFTKPFKYLGLTILVKREKSHPKSNLGSFLQPFANTLWVLVFLSVHVVALVLYLLDRFSPFGRYKFARGADTEEDALNLSSAMWFAWGVLLNSGIGEGTPRSFSARVLGMVWAGFAMIIVASYTANLAAFLVLDRPEALLSGIDDARLRNPQKDFKFATVKGSHVEAYFKSQLEYDTMLRIMTKNVYHSPDEAIAAVKSGDLKAFIWDSARLEYEAASECDLKTAGEVFGRTGYGLAMRKESPWLYEISQAVLNFHERGVMEVLDSQWILVKPKGCPRTDTSPATLGLTNMAGVFIMVAAGIVAGVFLIFIEMAYKKRTGLKEKELELARNAADRWRGNIEKRKILRKTMAAERMEKHMPLIGSGGVSSYPHSSFNNPPYERPRDCTKRVVRLTNQNGIFAEQPSAMDRV